MQTDYLKYWRVIRYYVKAKYNISTGELDMLLFLYSEDYFSKDKFKELLLITGKGIHSTTDDDAYISKELGKLKYSIPEFIKNNEELNKFIISINDAKKKDGGAGAIIIKLKNL